MGGCCGTTPDHIAAVAAAVKGVTPRRPDRAIRLGSTRLAGLEPFNINADTNFVNIGERCNVAGSKRFARLIREGKYDVS